ncbi:MAG TPA: hypothetical protein VNM43_01405 [Dehalococcoidia bacterium]|nr:hypothetical protein [Dehalococcoidia bacterium]
MAPSNDSSLRIREFLALVRDAVLDASSSGTPALQWRQRFSYLQFYRRDPRVHYEVWPQRKTGRIEVGLHFEGPREFSYAWAEVMARHAGEIMAALGPEVELEEWTPSWTRLHRSLPFEALTPALAQEAAAHVVRFMDALEPIVEGSWADVLAVSALALEGAERRRDVSPGRRFRRRGRARP